MSEDFSGLKFNRNHKQESAAREAIGGLRWLMVSIVLNLVVSVAAIATSLASQGLPGAVTAVIFLLMAVAFCTGAYGIYSMMEGLGWSGFVSVVVIASLLVPYGKMLTLFIVGALAMNLINQAGYRFTLFGAAKRSRPPPLPE